MKLADRQAVPALDRTDGWLDLEAVAARLGMRRNTVVVWRRRGKIAAEKRDGRAWWVSELEVRRLAARPRKLRGA